VEEGDRNAEFWVFLLLLSWWEIFISTDEKTQLWQYPESKVGF
jgi:hypothetical protein